MHDGEQRMNAESIVSTEAVVSKMKASNSLPAVIVDEPDKVANFELVSY